MKEINGGGQGASIVKIFKKEDKEAMRIERFVGARSQRNPQTILRYFYLSLTTLGKECNTLAI